MDALTFAITLQLIDNFTREISRVKESVDRINETTKRAQDNFKTLGERIKQAFDPKVLWEFSEKLENVALKSAQAAGAPLALLGKAVSSFEQLEHAEVKMEVAFMTASGLPQELEKIKKQVGELGVVLPGATKDFYEVATSLKNTGLTAKEISEGILKGASYAWVLFKDEASPKQAAEYMGQFANAYKIASNQFMDFVDILQRVKFATGLTLSEIAYSTKYFAAEINQLGLTGLNASKFMLAWVGALKRAGVEGTTAGTSIRSALQRIVEFDKHVEKLAKEGIKIDLKLADFKKDGQFQFEEFLMAVRNELSKIKDQTTRLKVMRELFDMEGMRAIAPLLASTKEEALEYLEFIKDKLKPEEYKAIKESIEKGGFTGLEGVIKDMEKQASLQQRIDRMLNTFANVKEAFLGTLESFGAIVGKLFAPPLMKIFNLLNTVFGALGDFIERHQTLAKVIGYPIGAFLAFIAILGTVSLALASFLKLVSFAIFPLGPLKNAIIQIIPWLKLKTIALWQNVRALAAWIAVLARTALSGIFSALISALKAVISAIRAFNLSLLFSPAGIFIAGIMAIVGVGYLLYRYWDRVAKALSSTWEWLKANWKRLAQFLLMLNPFTALLMIINAVVKRLYGISLFEAGAKLIRTFVDGIKSMAEKPIEVFKGIVQKIRNLLPFSPAKEGPLRDIHQIQLVETIAQSLTPYPLLDKMRQVLEPARASIQPLLQPVKQVLEPVRVPGKVASATPSNISITVNLGPINFAKGSPEEVKAFTVQLENEIRKVLDKIAKEKFRREY